MLMPPNYSLNAVLILLLGAVFLFGSVYIAYFMSMRLMAIGMFATAVGCIACGFTDGFTDPTPRGQSLKRLGGGAFLVGVPILAYTGYQMM